MRTTSEDAQSTPVQPASKRNAAAGKHPPAGVISDTLYWRRKIKANPQFAANKWRRMDPPHVRNLTTPHTSAPRYA